MRASAALAGAALLETSAPLRAAAQLSSDAVPLSVEIAFDQPGNTIPADFTGLGYEISSVARKGLLDSHNSVYVELVRTLGKSGVIRVGGNTSDFSRYAPNGPAVSSPQSTAVTAADLADLGGFLKATGWQLIWGLNLADARTPGNLANALDEAEAVVRYTGPHLLGIEIGNEPDLFWREHRPKPYTYENYRSEFEPVRDALLKRLPNVPLAGPDLFNASGWVGPFAAGEKQNLKLLTHHYYRENQNPASTSAKLLATDPHLAPMLAEMSAASQASGLPFRLVEVNSFSGGGKPGVSDTFTEALWVLDYMLRTAAGGASGVNIQTGVNHLGFISSYSPIGDDEHDRYTATPGFYGMLAFAQIGPGRLLPVSLTGGSVASGADATPSPNVTAYAVARPSGEVILAVINREPLTPVSLRIPHSSANPASLLRLEAPGLSATTGVALGGVPVSLSGAWHAPHWKPTPTDAAIPLPAASAVLLQLSRT